MPGVERRPAAARLRTVAWDEGDERPYFTDRPAWEGYRGLLVWAAHAEQPDLPPPAELPDSWLDDPAFQRSANRQFKTRFRTILEPQLWLATDFPFVFESPTLVSDEPTRIGSVFMLKQQLDTLHAETASHLARLTATRPADLPVSGKQGILGKLFGRQPEPEPAKSRLADAAQRGLQVFRDLAAKACEQRLPILLSF